MKAKTWQDTVLSDGQIGIKVSGFPFDVCPPEWKRVLEAQAEISFKMGYNQALKDHNLDITTSVVVE